MLDCALLLPEIGLLCETVPRSFIQTGSVNRELLLYDVLGNLDDPENTCDDAATSKVSTAQDTFFKRITEQLTRNGYVFDTDPDSIRVPQADDPISTPDLPLILSNHCSCANTQCSCTTEHNTTMDFTFTEEFTGHLNISLNLGDDHMLSRDIFSIKETENFALITTKLLNYRFRISSDDQIRIASISQDEHTAIITIVALNTRSLEISGFGCQKAPHHCQNNVLLFNVTCQQATASPTRSRRSWFFDLTTDREVNSKIRDAIRVNSKDLSAELLTSMSRELRRSGAALSQTNSELSSLYSDMCTSDYMTRKRITDLEAVINIQRTIDQLLEALRECSLGTIPHTTEHSTIMSFCYASLSPTICEEVAHGITTLMRCSIKRISILRDKYAVELSITVPESLNHIYTLYSLTTIPVYDHNSNLYRQLANLDGMTLAFINQTNESILLTDCKTENRMHICSSHADHTIQNPECISGLLHNGTKSCYTSTFSNNVNCIAKDVPAGILVSTRQSIPTHKHGLQRTFNTYSGKVNGVTLLQNNPDSSVTIECGSLIHSTALQLGGTVKVRHHDAFHWSNMTAQTDPELQRHITETRQEIDQHMNRLNGTFLTSLQDYTPHWLPNESSSRKLVLILITIIVFFCFIFFLIIRKYCKTTTFNYSPANLIRLSNFRQ